MYNSHLKRGDEGGVSLSWFNRPRLNRNVSVQAASPEPAEKLEVVNLANENLYFYQQI